MKPVDFRRQIKQDVATLLNTKCQWPICNEDVGPPAEWQVGEMSVHAMLGCDANGNVITDEEFEVFHPWDDFFASDAMDYLEEGQMHWDAFKETHSTFDSALLDRYFSAVGFPERASLEWQYDGLSDKLGKTAGKDEKDAIRDKIHEIEKRLDQLPSWRNEVESVIDRSPLNEADKRELKAIAELCKVEYDHRPELDKHMYRLINLVGKIMENKVPDYVLLLHMKGVLGEFEGWLKKNMHHTFCDDTDDKKTEASEHYSTALATLAGVVERMQTIRKHYETQVNTDLGR